MTNDKIKEEKTMRSERQEFTDRGRRRVTLTAGWWGRFGILRLQLCLILAATAIALPAQNEQDPHHPVNFTTLVNFDSTNGGNPAGSLVQGPDGNLYGTTFGGGANMNCFGTGCGTFFKMSPSGTLTTLYNFCSQANCADGGSPSAALVLGTDGNFYGITELGGANGSGTVFAGTVFRITPGGTLTTLYNWCSQPNCADGSYGLFPESGPPFVQASDGNFYGTTDSGGTFGAGTAFKLTPSGALTTLYTFCSQSGCADGDLPMGSLIQGSDGNFYGTTYFGGAYGYGTVYKITSSGTLTTLYSFCSQGGLGVCTDGALPIVPLIQANDGKFYGSTSFGGANVNSAYCAAESGSCGTVFKITPSGTLTTLYNFCSQANCTDGASAGFGLVQATDGNFYGTTLQGGGNTSCGLPQFGIVGCGTVFEMTPEGKLTTLHSFDSVFQWPLVLFQATNGTFYGTTAEGGAYSNCGGNGLACGIAFSLAVGLGPFVKTVPTAGTVAQAVTILGTDLSDATHVRFNHADAEFTVVSDTEIQTSVPAGATTGVVTVTRHGPRLKSNVKFQVLP